MNDTPASTLERKKDRRGLLALIGAGGAAAVTALLTRSDGAGAEGPTSHTSSTYRVPAVHGEWLYPGGSLIPTAAIRGHAHYGYGVLGVSDHMFGVYGTSQTGIGVTAHSKYGDALHVKGRARFNQAGKIWIPANRQFADKILDYDLDPDSLVLATPQSFAGGAAVRRAFIRKDAQGRWRILRVCLTESHRQWVKVAFFIFRP